MKFATDAPAPPRTWTEISAAAIEWNARIVRKYCPDAGIIAVLKADAYGHGAITAARALARSAEYFAVANLNEARVLRQGVPGRPILILSPALPEERPAIAAAGFIPTVSRYEEIAAYAALAGRTPLPVNLKIDTGMGRLGILLQEAAGLLQAARRLPGVEIRH
ncbi:MAG TPA: alanine racemase, partial [Chthoniobacterales bacterium]